MLSIFSCQKEDDVQTETYNKDISIKEYTFEEINSNKKFNTSFSKVINGIKKNGFSQESRGENNDFEIDSAIIKEISIGSITSYTFVAILDNPEPNSFSNIVIQIDSLENERALLITYFPESPMEYIEDHNSYTFNGTSIAEEIDIDSSFIGNRDMDMGCYVTWYCNWGGAVHPAGQNCTIGFMFPARTCSGGGGSTNNGGGNPDSGNHNNPDPINTAPVNIPYTQNLIQCLQLDQVENANFILSNWIYDPDNFLQVRSMSAFLNNKNCSDKAQEYVIASIEAIINGDIEEFDEDFYTWGVTKDDTFVDTDLDCIYEKMMEGNNFFKDMIFEFDQLTPLKFSIGPTPDPNATAFTKGETTTVFGQTHATYEIISSEDAESASNLDKMVTLSHELMHAFMFKSLEDWEIISFNNDGKPYLIETYDDMCQDDNLDEEININFLTMKERWVFLICEVLENSDDPNNNQQWTHSLFNSPVFFLETYREKLEQELFNNHDWNSEPTDIKNLMIQHFGEFNWKQKVAEYMSWSGLEGTPEFTNWLSTQSEYTSTLYPNPLDLWKEGVTEWWTKSANIDYVTNNCN
ncbi:hypothetical protein [Xanthomarina spongicola]|uniref:Uncharacterized protein n=1 Tax=Xanthomarina spongicola TaxID=570520 RepID=A0A316DLH4_9FLAO|nr:hypothetical protein [Xanthomarina spongicola]PWK18921.1 hypothetical protein LX78_01395 [Xanthomarina spongicola]